MVKMLYPRFHNVPKVMEKDYFFMPNQKIYHDRYFYWAHELGKLAFDKQIIIRDIRNFGAWGHAPFFFVCVGLLYFGSPCCK